MMDREKLQALTGRLLTAFPAEPVSAGALDRLESDLGVVIPIDLREIGKVFSGGMLGTEHLPLAPEGIGAATLALRNQIRLPERFLVLAEPPESLIVLETGTTPEGPAPVLWLDAMDAERLGTGEPLRNPDVFPSYGEFIRTLLDDK